MDKAIEYVWEWVDRFDIGLIKITNQKDRGINFNGGNPFIYRGVTLVSISFPAYKANGNTLWVRGMDFSRDNEVVMYYGTKKNFEDLLKAIEAYNDYQVKVDNINYLTLHRELWTKLANDTTLDKDVVVSKMCLELGIKIPLSGCFLCQEAFNNGKLERYCNKCKGYWGPNTKNCADKNSYYIMWLHETNRELKSALALRIANNTISNEPTAEEIDLAFQKGLVAGVKAYRSRTGLELRESKKMVEDAVEKDGREYISGGYDRIGCIEEELKMVRNGYLMQAVAAFHKRTGKTFEESKKIVYSWLD